MTRDDEYGDDLLEEYGLDFENLDEAFEMLYELEEDDPSSYGAVTGRIFTNIKQSTHVSNKDAYQVARYLSKGEIEEAEELTEELLEPEQR